MNAMVPRRRAVVIGAGIGGLTAAIELASRGWAVRIIEALERPGGKANVAQHDGVWFDTGPSLLTMPYVFEPVFARAGRQMADHVELLRPDPAFVYRWPDGASLTVDHDPIATLANVQRSFGADARVELERFLGYTRRIWEAAEPHFVAGPAPSLAGVFRLGPPGWRAATRIDAMRSMSAAIRSMVRTPHLRDVLLRYATYNGSDPRRAPATLNCIAWVELGLGGYGVRGGLYRLVEALVDAATSIGVSIECGRRVERVVADDGRIRGVVVDGAIHSCEVVVSNADAGHLRRALLPGSPGTTASTKQTPSTSGHTLVVRAMPRAERAAHTVWFGTPYENEFRDLFDRKVPPTVPTVYACDQRLAHGRAGWADGSAPVFLMANTPAAPARDAVPGEWADVAQQLLQRAVEGGLIGARERPVWERGPGELAAVFPDTQGALYGAASNGMWSAFRRPANRHPDISGLYLASGSAHPGGGVPLCALSGRRAAQEADMDVRGVR